MGEWWGKLRVELLVLNREEEDEDSDEDSGGGPKPNPSVKLEIKLPSPESLSDRDDPNSSGALSVRVCEGELVIVWFVHWRLIDLG